MTAEPDIRRIAGEDTIPVGVLRDFVLAALRHDAISDVLIERMVHRSDRGRLDAEGLAAALPELIGDVLDVVANEDWIAIAAALIEDMRDSLPVGAEP